MKSGYGLSVLCGVLAEVGVALSAYGLTNGNYTYVVTNGQATITKFSSSYTGDLSIMNALGGVSVTSIGAYAFRNCKRLAGIAIPAA